MLALVWPWTSPQSQHRGISSRLGTSLCAGLGGHAGTAEIEGIHLAFRLLASTEAQMRSWRPSISPDGRITIFHGYFDNSAEIAAELGVNEFDVASLYARAIDTWADEADLKIIGEYCAVVADPGNGTLRLARSPLRAPPLYYFQNEEMAVAGSVPRIFFAAGAPQRLNETRVADSGMINFSDQEASWFEDIYRVPLGSVVQLQRGQPRALDRYYDPSSVRAVHVASDADCLARVSELLDEAVRACLAGHRKPGVALSGGLDSPQIAVRALAMLAPGKRLPTFTFHPEPEYDGIAPAGTIGDERRTVETFAAQHPLLDLHFTANQGYGHDHRWNDFFHLMGGAPTGLCNMYVFHGLFSGAAKQGCDVLLHGEWGNFAFSDEGQWGFVEYLLKGRWKQLWLSLRSFPRRDRGKLWRFAAHCILPLLPNRLWRLVRTTMFPAERPMLDLFQPFTSKFRIGSGAERRLRKSGIIFDRYQPWNAQDARRLLLQNDDFEGAEVFQAFEQMYGVPQRDPMAYRPLVEFCWGLPTKMYMRDGQMRWLAKQMARGIMPEEQRANRLNGRWDADWHLRIGRRRDEYLAEFDRLAADERFAAMLDLPRMRAALEDWPEQTETDPQLFGDREFAVPRALLTAHFINYVEGRNEP